MKQSKKFFILFISAVAVLAVIYFFFLSPRYSVPILMYHDFGSSANEGDPLAVTPDRFEEQMAYLKKHDYKVISLDALVDGIREGKKFPFKTVVITIDDGNKTNYTYAYPILKKYGFPAIIFLPTNRIEVNKKYLTWAEIKEMSRNGISFGSHTKEHLVLSRLTDQNTLWDEIAGSKAMIEQSAGIPVLYFSYPIGVFTQQIKDLVKEAGYKAAVTTNRGKDYSNTRDLYELHRVSVRNGDLSWSFWGKLSGYYNFFRKAKDR